MALRDIEVGAFVRAKRLGATSFAEGIPDHGKDSRRRTPGLTRDELASLAGVSTSYITRIEQGRAGLISDSVLIALGCALRFDPDETQHLRNLTRAIPRRSAIARSDAIRPDLTRLIDTLDSAAAMVIHRDGDILAWNRRAHRLTAFDLDFDAPQVGPRRPNLHRRLFLTRPNSALFENWEIRARDTTANLRMATGRWPHDQRLHLLVSELRSEDPGFARLWSEQHARQCADRVEPYLHPRVGTMLLSEEVVDLPHGDGAHLILITPAAAAEPETTRRFDSLMA